MVSITLKNYGENLIVAEKETATTDECLTIRTDNDRVVVKHETQTKKDSSTEARYKTFIIEDETSARGKKFISKQIRKFTADVI